MTYWLINLPFLLVAAVVVGWLWAEGDSPSVAVGDCGTCHDDPDSDLR